MKIRINKKENILFMLKVFFTPIIWLMIFACIAGAVKGSQTSGTAAVVPILIYVVAIILYFYISKVFMVGYLKGNGVEVNKGQFPEFYEFYENMARDLDLKKVPPLFVLQKDGALNAFAVRLSCKNYIAVYSEIFEMYDTEPEAVKFILGHELGHVKRDHMQKKFWTAVSSVIPFLGAAYSRSCEYTCDNIGCDLSDFGAEKGLLVLASGKKLYAKINADKYVENAKKQRSFSVLFSELCSGHPYLPNRIKNISRKESL